MGLNMIRLVLLSLVLVVSTSCMKKLSESDNDGPVASADDVQAKLFQAWGDVAPETINKNEFTYIEREQKIQDYDPTLIMQEGITVSDRVVNGSEIDYTLVHQINDLSGGDSKLSSTEEKVSVTLSDPSLTAQMKVMQQLHSLRESTLGESTPGASTPGEDNTSVHQSNLSVQNVQALMLACVSGKDWDVTCHNLTYTEETRPAPDLVKAQPNCANLPNCEIHVRKVSFDIIVNVKTAENTTEKQKVQYSIAISPDAPYLSRLVDYCYRGLILVPSAGQKVLVGVCSYVKNFKLGQN